jgi:hypothetical protein
MPKPNISSPEIEFDATLLDLLDLGAVPLWPDTSGQGNDAAQGNSLRQPTFRLDGWQEGIDAVQFEDLGVGGQEDEMIYDAQVAFRGSQLTLFIVAQIIDITEGAALIGTITGATPPREIDVCVFPTGEILFGFGTETIPTAVQTNIITAPGTVKAGDKVLITCRSSNGAAGVDPEGMLIRLNGEQVASVPSFVTPPNNVVGAGGVQVGALGRSANTGSPELGLPGGAIHGVDRLIAWIGGYSVAATNQEIVDMEEFLLDKFFSNPTIWTPFPQVLIPGLPKPNTISRPIVEFDVRNIGFPYVDQEVITLWEDLETSDPQGRTDAGAQQLSGEPTFLVDGWTPGVDAVRFVGAFPPVPTNPEYSFMTWAGGGSVPGASNWQGNNYTIFGVMRAIDITLNATFCGNTAGLSPNFPKKVAIWVQPDGSIAVHHTDEENAGTLQSGSSFSLETAPGLVEPGDDLLISLTCSAVFGPRQGKILRINGVEVARNDQAFAAFFQESINPALGQGFPEQLGPGPSTVGGLDRLIVYMSAFGSLASAAEVLAYESFLAGAFQLDFRTQWADKPEVSPGTVWANIS